MRDRRLLRIEFRCPIADSRQGRPGIVPISAEDYGRQKRGDAWFHLVNAYWTQDHASVPTRVCDALGDVLTSVRRLRSQSFHY